jgi:glutathione S-transferase
MKLYEFGPTRSLRARWTLQELGVDFESVKVNILQGELGQPAFRELNPAAKLPVLVDGDFVLTESAAIALYLGEKYPDRRLIPADLRERAEMYRWLMFTVTELEQPLWRMTRHRSIYPEAERLPADIAIASCEFKQMAQVLEAHMRGREYVAGKGVTVADFVLAYTLDWGNEVKLLDDTPGLIEYMERMYARPRAAPRIAQAYASIKPG